MGNKKSLDKASRAKDDEYYTLYEDIANEIPKYREQLKGKRIICPCDWDESYNEEIVYHNDCSGIRFDLFGNGVVRQVDVDATKPKIEKNIRLVKCNFVKFLIAHADDYGIKSISVSGYNPATCEGIRFQDVDYSKYDLIITNPPFSQFVEFIDKMIESEKEFLVIGPLTALTYKSVFNYIKNNKMWIGYAKQLSGFGRPNGVILLSKEPAGSVPRACKWYTNLDVSYRHDRMILTERYDAVKYPPYYNYNGIDVNKTICIPYDYSGVMGVPVSFMQKFNPQQFEIVGQGQYIEKTRKAPDNCLWIEQPDKSLKKPFERILVRNINPITDDEL